MQEVYRAMKTLGYVSYTILSLLWPIILLSASLGLPLMCPLDIWVENRASRLKRFKGLKVEEFIIGWKLKNIEIKVSTVENVENYKNLAVRSWRSWDSLKKLKPEKVVTFQPL